MIDHTKITQTMIFPTSILSYTFGNVDELNTELKQAILEKKQVEESVEYSNVGGYHSPSNLLDWDYDCIKTFTSMITEMATQMAKTSVLSDDGPIGLGINAWSNVMTDGNYHLMHNHPNNFWSGCYYVSTGNPDKSIPYNSYFEATDPRPGAKMIESSAILLPRYRFQPIEGMILMFPSFVNHLVHPFRGKGKRISIAFNVGIIQ